MVLHDNFAIFDLCGLWSIRRGESPERKKLDTMKQNNKQLPAVKWKLFMRAKYHKIRIRMLL